MRLEQSENNMSEISKKVLKVRKYKAGYEIREEYWDDSPYGGSGITMKSAYTPSGDYIGDSKWAYRLCKKWGIKPEKISSTSSVCSIGFCEKEQKWYGWSHRAMYGFGIGSKVKRGDCAFTPGSAMELYASLSKDEQERIVAMDGDKITLTHTTYKAVPLDPNNPEGELIPGDPREEEYCIEVGRGEWEAKTLEDAKQMAIDFARSVS